MGKQLSREEIVKAAQEVLGRKGKAASDESLYAMYKDMDLKEVQRAFAGSAEAQRAGTDTSKYGVEFIDPAKLDDEGKKLVSTYERVYGKGKKVRMSVGDYENWRKNGSAELMEAEAKGDVKVRMSEGRRVLEVSKKAYQTYGTKLFTGLHKNEAVLVEKGAGSDLESVDKRWRQSPRGVEAKTLEKWEVWTKDPKKHSGVVGSAAKAVGLSKGTANSLDKAVGQTITPALTIATGGAGYALSDEAAAIGGGTRGAAARNKQLSGVVRAVGVGKKDAERLVGYGDVAGDVATAIGAGVADSVTFGAATAANQAMEAAQRSTLGEDMDWEKVGRDIAVSWASYGIGKGLEAGKTVATTAGAARTAAAFNTAQNVWKFGGSQVASSVASGGNTEDHLYAAGRGIVLSALPQDRVTQGIAASSLSYYDAKRRGLDDEQAMIAASAAGASAAVSAQGGNSLFAAWKARPGQLRQEFADTRQAFRGNIPERWRAEAAAFRQKDWLGRRLPERWFRAKPEAAAIRQTPAPFPPLRRPPSENQLPDMYERVSAGGRA